MGNRYGNTRCYSPQEKTNNTFSFFYETHADSHEALTCTFNILTVWKWKRMAFFDSFSTTKMFSHISPKNSKGVGELMSFQHLGTRPRSIEGNRKLRKPLFHFDALVALCIFFSSSPLQLHKMTSETVKR